MINLIKIALMITVMITSASHFACLLIGCSSSVFDCSNCWDFACWEFNPVSQCCWDSLVTTWPWWCDSGVILVKFKAGPVSKWDNFELSEHLFEESEVLSLRWRKSHGSLWSLGFIIVIVLAGCAFLLDFSLHDFNIWKIESFYKISIFGRNYT